MDADFLQVADNAGADRIVLGMKFRNEADTSDFAALLEQCTASGDPDEQSVYLRNSCYYTLPLGA